MAKPRFVAMLLTAILWSFSVQADSVPSVNSTFFEISITIPKLQYNFSEGGGGDSTRLQQIQGTINDTWNLYVQQAWGFDEVKPVTGGGVNTLYHYLVSGKTINFTATAGVPRSWTV